MVESTALVGGWFNLVDSIEQSERAISEPRDRGKPDNFFYLYFRNSHALA